MSHWSNVFYAPILIIYRGIHASSLLSILVLYIILLGYPAAIYSSSIDHFNIIAVGDFDCFPRTFETVDNIMHLDPELVIALGDLSYQDTADCWFDIVDPIDEKIKIVIGNHDLDSPKLEQYMGYFNLTEQFYSFNYQNVHFIVLSDYLPYEVGSDQYNFVKNDLQYASEDHNVDWIIVSHHNPKYASAQDSIGSFATSWIEIFHPLFEDYGVDIVLQGDQHNYQRTYPLEYNEDEPINPIISDEASPYSDPVGQIFATVGTGGATLHHPLGKAFYTDTMHVGWGVLNIAIINDDASSAQHKGEQGQITKLIGTFYANDRQEKIDEFAIQKPRIRSG
jgi:calcineurin-like phosphoesterase family protein